MYPIIGLKAQRSYQCVEFVDQIMDGINRRSMGSDLACISTVASVLVDLCWEKLHTGHWEGVDEVS